MTGLPQTFLRGVGEGERLGVVGYSLGFLEVYGRVLGDVRPVHSGCRWGSYYKYSIHSIYRVFIEYTVFIEYLEYTQYL